MSAPSTPRVVELLDLADRTIGAWLARVTRGEDLTREQWRTLVLLDSCADPGTDGAPGHTMGEIAGRAGVPAPTATRLVDRLVADGLAYRRSDPWDRRRVLVHISGDGHELLERATAALEDTLGAALAGVGRTARLDLLDLLQRLAAATEAASGATDGSADAVPATR